LTRPVRLYTLPYFRQPKVVQKWVGLGGGRVHILVLILVTSLVGRVGSGQGRRPVPVPVPRGQEWPSGND